MEKFFKSIFGPEKRKGSKHEAQEEDRNDFTPPLDGRRKLSISRSGRMKQANKKRHSLSLELYGEADKPVEKPKSREYHVKNTDIMQKTEEKGRQLTPEEEIECAFQVIDKVS